MKWISFENITAQTKNILYRFPIQCIIIIVATIAAYSAIGSNDTQYLLAKILLFCSLSFALSLAMLLFAESSEYGLWKTLSLQLAALVLCFFIVLPLTPHIKEANAFTVLFLQITFCLFVTFAAFYRRGEVGRFWHFNKTVFLRALTAALYSAVIIAGLSLAVFAIKQLFNVNVENIVYRKIFAVVSIAFGASFLLAGIPAVKQRHAGQQYLYPQALKIFTQYVLIPLMLVYLVILLIYEVKISVEWQLPNGYVSSVILAYALAGILSQLLIYPVRDKEDSHRIKWFSKWFYITLIPLIVLLVLAIYKRVADYGITVERYVLMTLALWLSAMTVYFLFSKTKNIKVIPVTLSLTAFIAAIGPLSASSVSEKSQQKRLHKYINDTSVKGKRETSSIINYLVEMNGLTALQPFTTVNLNPVEKNMLQKESDKYSINTSLKDTAFALLKKEKTDPYDLYRATVKFHNSNPYGIVNTKGYTYAMPLDPRYEKTFQLGKMHVSIEETNNNYTLKLNDTPAMQFPVDSLFKRIADKYADSLQADVVLPDTALSISRSNRLADAKIVVVEYTKYSDDSTYKPHQAYILLNPKE